MGVKVRTEVYGLFAVVLPQAALEVLSRWPTRKRQGLALDFAIALPEHGQSPTLAQDALFELNAAPRHLHLSW